MYCSNCGQAIGEEVRFCPNCGNGRTGEMAASAKTFPAPTFQSPDRAIQPSVSGMAVAGLVCSLFIGIIGLILSIIALNQINNSNGALSGRGLAIAGIWISAVSMVFMFVVLAAG